MDFVSHSALVSLALLFSQIDLRAAAIGGVRLDLLALLVATVLAARRIGTFRW